MSGTAASFPGRATTGRVRFHRTLVGDAASRGAAGIIDEA
jgi:hypothetical protein